MSATVSEDGVATLQFFPGLGYSHNSGSAVGGLGTSDTPLQYSTTFFGSDVKGLLPPNLTFGIRRSLKTLKKKRKNSRKFRKSHRRHFRRHFSFVKKR